MPKSLLDLMPKEEADKAVERGKKRLARQRTRKGLDVSPEIYLVAEFGYYLGWEGILDLRRGYTISEDLDKDGKLIYVKSILTLEEAQVILEGVRKVWYSKLIEETHSRTIGNSNKITSPFDKAIKPFVDKAEVTE